MRCAEVHGELDVYSVGLLGKWSAVRVRLHIARCSACRRELELMREADLSLRAALRQRLQSPDISGRVMPLLTAPLHVAADRPRWRPAVGFAVLTLLGLTLVVTLQQPRQEIERIATAPEPSVHQVSPRQKIPAESLLPKPQEKTVVETTTVTETRRHKQVAIVEKRDPESGSIHRDLSTPDPPVELVEPQEHTELATVAPDSQIIIVVAQPEIPQPMTIEIESTNQETGAVVYYSKSRDSRGNEQMALLTYTPAYHKEEATEL